VIVEFFKADHILLGAAVVVVKRLTATLHASKGVSGLVPHPTSLVEDFARVAIDPLKKLPCHVSYLGTVREFISITIHRTISAAGSELNRSQFNNGTTDISAPKHDRTDNQDTKR
jgi:hypothetical protein